MTSERDITVLLDRWLADGPLEVSDEVFDRAVDRIRRERQRPAWRVLWRDPPMQTYVKPLAALAAVVVLAVAGWSLLPGSVGPGTFTPSPTPSLQPTPTPRPITAVGPLSPGTYHHEVDAGTIVFTTPADGWSVESAGPLDLALLVETASGEQSLRVFADMHRAAKDAPCTETPEAGVGMSAADLVADLAADNQLDVSAPTPIEIDGFPGQIVDVGLAAGATRTCPFAGEDPTVPLIVDDITGIGPFWGIGATERERLVILDMPDGGNVVIVLTAAPPEAFDELLAAGMPVAESIGFDPRP